MLLFLFVLRILFLPFFQGPSLPVHHKEMDRKPDVEQSDYYKPNPSCGIQFMAGHCRILQDHAGNNDSQHQYECAKQAIRFF